MLTKKQLKEVEGWVKGGRRAVDVEIDNRDELKYEFKLWFYDYDLGIGSFVKPLQEDFFIPNLEGRIEKEEKEQLERLKAKYEL